MESTTEKLEAAIAAKMAADRMTFGAALDAVTAEQPTLRAALVERYGMSLSSSDTTAPADDDDRTEELDGEVQKILVERRATTYLDALELVRDGRPDLGAWLDRRYAS
jgi:hypothetical protein